MEELISILNVLEINYLHIEYTDTHGNNKVLKLDYRRESEDKNNDN